MPRLLSLCLLALTVAGCANTGRSNTGASVLADLRLDAAALSADQTIVENAMTQPELSTLVAAVQRAGLVDALNGPGPFTVFAPVNAAWTSDVSSMAPEALAAVLQYHVVEGDLSAADLSDGAELRTLNGESVEITLSESLDPPMVDDADIVYTDIEASNGRIHLINLVLDPTSSGDSQVR